MTKWYRVVRYFDLAAEVRERHRGAGGDAGAEEVRVGVFPQYAAVTSGVVVQPLFDTYRASGAWDFGVLGGWLPFALVVSLLIFPGVYRNVWDPKKPTFVQLCTIFSAGLGWEAVLSTGLRAATGA